MTTPYQRPVTGFRFVEILHGDSLQTIAARELGDANRWTELIAYNGLVPPFVTDDPAAARLGVLLSGGMIRLPAPVAVATAETDPDRVFEVDARLVGGQLATLNGDLEVVSGRANLRQALVHRIETERGELIFHPEYGSRVRSLIGAVTGPTATLLAAQYAKSAVQADPRISRVTQAVAAADGDAIRVDVEAQPVIGRAIDVSATP